MFYTDKTNQTILAAKAAATATTPTHSLTVNLNGPHVEDPAEKVFFWVVGPIVQDAVKTAEKLKLSVFRQ